MPDCELNTTCVCVQSFRDDCARRKNGIRESSTHINQRKCLSRAPRNIESYVHIFSKSCLRISKQDVIKHFGKPIRQVQVYVYNIITLHIKSLTFYTNEGKNYSRHDRENLAALCSVIYVSVYLNILHPHLVFIFTADVGVPLDGR